jgi:predicted transcriptional regulator
VAPAEHDPWPWLTYFTGVLDRSYRRLEERVASSRSTGTKQDRVTDNIRRHAGATFRISDIRTALPGISDATIRIAMESLRAQGVITVDGTGRSATLHRTGPSAVSPR